MAFKLKSVSNAGSGFMAESLTKSRRPILNLTSSTGAKDNCGGIAAYRPCAKGMGPIAESLSGNVELQGRKRERWIQRMTAFGHEGQ